MKKPRVYVSALLVAPVFLHSSYLSAGEPVRWELPDSRFIRDECELLRVLAQMYSPAHLTSVRTTCESALQGKLSSDQWLKDIDPISREIDGRIPCRGCVPILLEERQPIPDNFLSYSIFLAPSELLEQNSEAQAIEALRQAFESFGDAIGDTRAAIWFSNQRHARVASRDSDKPDSGLVRLHYTDVLRSKDYCDRFNLSYNDGPYVVTTKRRPDLATVADEKVVIKLAGISPEGIIKILNVLEPCVGIGRYERERFYTKKLSSEFCLRSRYIPVYSVKRPPP